MLAVVPGVVAEGTGVVVLDAGPRSNRKGGRTSPFVTDAEVTCGDPGVAPDGYDPPSPVCAEDAPAPKLTPRLKVTIAMRSNRIAMPLRKRRRGSPKIGAMSTLNRSQCYPKASTHKKCLVPRFGKYSFQPGNGLAVTSLGCSGCGEEKAGCVREEG